MKTKHLAWRVPHVSALLRSISMDHMESVVWIVRLLWFVSSVNKVTVNHTINQFSGMHFSLIRFVWWIPNIFIYYHLGD